MRIAGMLIQQRIWGRGNHSYLTCVLFMDIMSTILVIGVHQDVSWATMPALKTKSKDFRYPAQVGSKGSNMMFDHLITPFFLLKWIGMHEVFYTRWASIIQLYLHFRHYSALSVSACLSNFLNSISDIIFVSVSTMTAYDGMTTLCNLVCSEDLRRELRVSKAQDLLVRVMIKQG